MGMGFGEVVLILMIVAVAFGSTKMPGPGDMFGRWMRGEDPSQPSAPAQGGGRWTTVDWLLLTTTLAIAVTLTIAVTHGR